MSQRIEDLMSSREDEHESLLSFFYMCPIGVVRRNLNGGVGLANPHAAPYLLVITRTPDSVWREARLRLTP